MELNSALIKIPITNDQANQIYLDWSDDITDQNLFDWIETTIGAKCEWTSDFKNPNILVFQDHRKAFWFSLKY